MFREQRAAHAKQHDAESGEARVGRAEPSGDALGFRSDFRSFPLRLVCAPLTFDSEPPLRTVQRDLRVRERLPLHCTSM